MSKLKSGVELIHQARQNQIEKHGYTDEHDDEHTEGEIAMAAACYAAPRRIFEREDRPNQEIFQDPWPWDQKFDKRPRWKCANTLGDNRSLSSAKRVHQLAKAGALIAAEIDRLQRLEVIHRPEPLEPSGRGTPYSGPTGGG